MLKNKKFLIAKISLVLGAVPFVVHGYETGPDAFRSGAPGEQTCLGSGCHSGSLNPGVGGVKIVPANGNTYTPGVKQRIMVQITDSTRQKFGFELTARLASNTMAGQAGDLASVDAQTQVICGDGGPKPAAGCGTKAGISIQFIEHTFAGYSASTAGGYTYQFDWTPPATNVGNVILYVAANAGPGGSPNQNNANVYTSNVTLTPAAAASGPTINTAGVVPLYSTSTTIQPGSWFSIYGSNLAPSTASWNGDYPISLGGTSVTINGKNAYFWFVSDGQINAMAPDDTATGSVPVVVTTASGSTTSTVTLEPAGPSFLVIDAKHITGLVFSQNHTGSQGGGVYDFLGPTSTGTGFRPAKAGDAVVLYGVGFGPTNPVVPAGKSFSGVANMVTLPKIMVGGGLVNVDSAAVVGFTGLYQFNFKMPANAGTGDVAVVATAGGLQTQPNLTIPAQ